jgi:predicted transposase/invertase (TIGR01784 family)
MEFNKKYKIRIAKKLFFFYCIGNFTRNFRSNKVKLPWAVRICKAKRTCGEATIHKNEEYNCLNKTIGIIITDFKINGLENLDYFTNWKIIETEGRETILTDYFELYIIELPKIYNKRQGEEDKLFEWMRFLENPVSREVEVIMKNNDGIKKAKEKLEEISNDEIMQKLAEWKEAAAHDEASTIATAKIEEKRNIAIKMIRNGIKLDLIKEITGLSEEEIKTLANK